MSVIKSAAVARNARNENWLRELEKRGVETDYACQTDLLGQWGQRKPEVLRFEIRLTGRKLKSLIKTWRMKNDCTLDGLFSPDLSRSVLLHFW